MEGICDNCLDAVFDDNPFIQKLQDKIDMLEWNEEEETEEEFWRRQDELQKALEEKIKSIAVSMGSDLPDHECLDRMFNDNKCCCSCH